MRTAIRLVLVLLLLPVCGTAAAQSFSLGADLVSRYVWRGTDFGQAATVQPALTFSAGSFEIGSWASYSIFGGEANEHDLWLGYSVEAGSAGTLSFGVTDYYFPAPGAGGWADFSGDGDGAHLIEPYVGFEAAVGFSVTAYVMAHNDPDHSIYVEASMPTTVGGVDIAFTAGAVTGKSAFYGTEGLATVNLSIAASKDLPLNSKNFSLPVSVAYILNPAAEVSFLVFGIGIGL